MDTSSELGTDRRAGWPLLALRDLRLTDQFTRSEGCPTRAGWLHPVPAKWGTSALTATCCSAVRRVGTLTVKLW